MIAKHLRRLVHGLVLAASFTAFVCSASGCRLDCFDEGPLQEAYGDGVIQAEDQNRIEYDTGLADGQALSRIDGEEDGRVEGYDFGYSDGYNTLYPVGYDDGYDFGWSDGYADPGACAAGIDDGAWDGDSAGYAAGWDASYDGGWDDGYAVGYQDGQNSCGTGLRARPTDADKDPAGHQATHEAHPAAADGPVIAHADEVDPDDLAVCYDRGYRATYDATAYPRGLADGKVENPEYQAGYQSTYPAAYDQGVIAGESDGYADGYDFGYSDGFAYGYDEAYYACYDPAYQDAYQSGYNAGYDDGYYSGYDDGYYSGYDAGVADCG